MISSCTLKSQTHPHQMCGVQREKRKFNCLLHIFQVRYTYINIQTNIVSMRYKVISEKAHVVEHCIKIIIYTRMKTLINK